MSGTPHLSKERRSGVVDQSEKKDECDKMRDMHDTTMGERSDMVRFEGTERTQIGVRCPPMTEDPTL